MPLEQFEDVDLANNSELALFFDQSQAGTLFIADLVFVQGDS
jgi:hypothetical protein